MLSLWLSIDPAAACGGFFCGTSAPVVQKAERIVFTVDPVSSVVETHVQVEYEGPAEDFAWIVPVQAEPELFLSSDMLFNTVAQQLTPQFWLDYEEEGWCKNPFRIGFAQEYALSADAAPETSVDVVGTATVGPYETVTLQADSTADLLQWLEDNDFDIPSTAGAALAPYVAGGAHFVALKLTKGNDAGDLRPFGMRYQGTRPAIPIQLTSIASAEDLRLEVTVFGHQRAVPESYLHVEINEAAIDWFSNGSNYQDVITRAADEAGGHAFATDYAGSTDVLSVDFLVTTDVDSLLDAGTPTQWITRVQSLGFRGDADLMALFESLFPVQPGLDPVTVYNCPECQSNWYAGPPFDAEEATAALVEKVVEPRDHVRTLIESYPYVTRMTSSLSAAEMTVDPVFTFTDGMPDVPLQRNATLVMECTGGKYRRRADRRIDLSSGASVHLPSQRWFEKEEITVADYLADLDMVNASRIEKTDSNGATVIADLSDQIADQLSGTSRGCTTAAGALPGAFVGLLGLFGLRRRR